MKNHLMFRLETMRFLCIFFHKSLAPILPFALLGKRFMSLFSFNPKTEIKWRFFQKKIIQFPTVDIYQEI